MLTAKQITVIKNTKILLDKVSLSLCPGELLVVLGPNGAGKSTLLRALSDEWPTNDGYVTMDQDNITQLVPQQRARTMAVLPQSSQLNFTFSVLEVVMLGRLPHDTLPAINMDIAYQCLQKMDAEYLANRDYITLSGGEKQRVQLARVFAQIDDFKEDSKPRYLLLDEPILGLDLQHQHSVFAYIKQLTQQRVGVLAIIHDLNIAAQYADRLLLLKHGKIVNQGSPAKILTKEIIKEVFNMDVSIIQHPDKLNYPLVIAKGN